RETLTFLVSAAGPFRLSVIRTVRHEIRVSLRRLLQYLGVWCASQTIALLLFFSLLTTPASAVDIQLPPETGAFKQAAGAELANGQCLVCHSVEYVTTQPRMGRAFWKGSVVKMQQKYGAPIPEAQVEPLVDYLTRNYGLVTNNVSGAQGSAAVVTAQEQTRPSVVTGAGHAASAGP